VGAAGFEEVGSLESVAFDRPRVRDRFTLPWLEVHETLACSGPVGGGKTVFACALGHRACRVGARGQALVRLPERFGAARLNAAGAHRVEVRRGQRILPARVLRPPARFVPRGPEKEEAHVDERP
jgi:hypothetical protein